MKRYERVCCGRWLLQGIYSSQTRWLYHVHSCFRSCILNLQFQTYHAFFWMGKTLPPPNHHNRGKPTNGRLMRWALSPDVNKGHPGEFLKSTLTRKYKGINNTVDGRNPAPVEVGSLSHYLQGFLHPRWCRISSINSMIHQLAIRTIHGPSHQSISIHSLIRIRHWITESMLPSGFSKPWKSPPPPSLTYL